VFEAAALAISEVKQRVETPSDQGRAIPLAERTERHLAQQNRLTGILISGPLEPSHALLDIMQAMNDSGIVEYVSLDKATSREAEMEGVKRVQALSIVGGLLKVDDHNTDLRFDVTAAKELDLYWAFHRRSLAFDQSDLIEYSVQAAFIQKIFAETRKAVPPGFEPVSIHQILEADRTLWRRIAERVRKGLRKLGGVRPLQVAFTELQNHPTVEFCLLPRHGHGAKRINRSRSRTPSRKPRRSRSRTPPRTAKSDGKKKRKEKKPKDDAEKKRGLPEHLKGLKARDSSNRPFCFAFNAQGCTERLDSNGRCRKGMHVCMKCQKPGHGALQCS
jgi:hypothetical protein